MYVVCQAHKEEIVILVSLVWKGGETDRETGSNDAGDDLLSAKRAEQASQWVGVYALLS